MTATENALLSAPELEEQLRAVGEERYHHQHPFHRLMNEGRLDREQIRLWAANRFYYQIAIPVKDAAILSISRQRDQRTGKRCVSTSSRQLDRFLARRLCREHNGRGRIGRRSRSDGGV